jgi:hypothetical protein
LERSIKGLRLQMEKNVQDYDENITGRFSKVVRTTQRTEKQVKEKQELLNEVMILKKIFGISLPNNFYFRVAKYIEHC